MRFLVFFMVLVASIQFCHAQGEVENSSNNSNTGNTPTLFETNTFINSNAVIPTLQDTIQINVYDQDDEIEMKKSEKNKKSQSIQQKTPSSLKDNKTVSETKTESSSSMNMLNQSFSIVYEESRMQNNQRNPTAEQQQKLNKTIEKVQSIDSNSFDYHLMKIKAGNYDVKNYYHLVKANELNASHPELQRQYLAYYVIKTDTTSIKLILDSIDKENTLSSEFIDYGADLLYSVPQNSTLLTHSFDDTYAVLFNQLNNHKREDVSVINLDFCQSQEYRNLLIKKGYKLSYNGAIDTKFLADFIILNPTKRIALSMTLPKDYFLNQPANLGICGLTFIPDNKFNLTEYNQSLWENSLSKKVLYSESDLSNRLSKNFLPLLLELSQIYQDKNLLDKKQEVDQWITKIGIKTNISDQLKKLKD